MSYANPIKRMMKMDAYIREKSTGTPKEFAKKIGISERALYEGINNLKWHFNCPIAYCRQTKTYYYTEKGGAVFGFRETKPKY